MSSVSIGSGFIVITKDWASFKVATAVKKLLVQYEEGDGVYEIFGVDGAIVYSTIIYTGTVPVGSAVDQVTNDANKAEFEASYKTYANQPVDIASRLVTVNINAAFPSTAYGLVIDLDNAGGTGPYKHVGNSSIKAVAILGSAVKSEITDAWVSQGGVVLAIDATETTIAWLQPGSTDLTATDTLEKRVETNIAPVFLDLKVAGGALQCLADNDIETVTAINTTTPLLDIGGTPRVLAPGDMILRAVRSVGAGTLTSNFMLWYYVE